MTKVVISIDDSSAFEKKYKVVFSFTYVEDHGNPSTIIAFAETKTDILGKFNEFVNPINCDVRISTSFVNLFKNSPIISFWKHVNSCF